MRPSDAYLLLRPSEAPPTAPTELLRPAEAAPATPAAELLRPADDFDAR